MGIQINGQDDSVTASDGSLRIGGNVSIPGVLTYEDVTSVDSVGIVTAQAGIHVTGGNVSIGHDNPSHKLDVVGNTQLYGTVLVGANNDISPSSSGTGQLLIDANGYTPYIAADGTAMYIGHNSAARDLILQTDETDRLVIDGANGNVGIGTDDPGQLLTVGAITGGADGNLSVKTNSNNHAIAIEENSGNENYQLGVNSSGDLGFYNSGATVATVTFADNNNVGIGTDNPTERLHLIGGSSSSAGTQVDIMRLVASDFSPTNSGGLTIGAVWHNTDVSRRISYLQSSQNLNSGSTNRALCLNPNGGNIGIGTDDPGSPLHVFGSSDVSSLIDAAAGDGLLTIRNAGNGNWSGINFTRERSTGPNVTGGSIWMPSDTSNNSATLYLQTQSASANAGADGALTSGNGVRIKLSSQPSGVGTHSSFSVEVGDEQRFEIKNSGQIGLGNTGFGGLNNQTIISNGGSAAATWGGVNQYAFYGEQDTAQTIAHNTYTHLVNFATNTVTSGSALLGIFNEAGGRFTVGTHGAGLYYLTMTAGIDDIQANDFVQVVIAKNGTNQAWDSSTRLSTYGRGWNSGSANQVVTATVSCISYLNAGDVVSFYVYHNEGTSEPTEQNRTSVMGFRLST
jgi:hypothetical protein